MKRGWGGYDEIWGGYDEIWGGYDEIWGGYDHQYHRTCRARVRPPVPPASPFVHQHHQHYHQHHQTCRARVRPPNQLLRMQTAACNPK